MKYQIFLFVSFLFIGQGIAQYPTEGQYQSIPNPDPIPAKPDYLGTIIDNSVPSDMLIRRISEYYEPANWYPKYEYAKIQPWNADGTKYKFYSRLLKDAATHEIIREMPASDLYPSVWSNKNSDLIYGFRINGDIKAYDTNTEVMSIILSVPGYEFVKLGPGEGNIDANDKYVALVGKKSKDLDVIIVDLDEKKIVTTKTFAGAWDVGNENSPKYIDWVSVSQSGSYVAIMWNHNTTSDANPYNGHFGVELYNTVDMNYLRRLADYGNHGDFCYAQDGKEVFAQFWGPNVVDFVNMYYLDGSGRVSLATHADFDAAGHISCRNLDRQGWLYLTITSAAQSGQMVAMKLDNSGIVEHFGHHYSQGWSSMAVPSPDGTRLMFKSTFHEDLAADEIYIYESTLSAPLAVEWMKPLVASQKKDDIVLSWSVAHQINNDQFIVEHSQDGVQFEPLAKFDGDGNLPQEKALQFLHENPKKGDHFYRIRQIDFDGKYDFSNVAMVRIKEGSAIQLLPNPAFNEVTIYANSLANIEQVVIHTLTGKIVKTFNGGYNHLNISDLPKGMYVVSVQMQNGLTEKMLVVE